MTPEQLDWLPPRPEPRIAGGCDPREAFQTVQANAHGESVPALTIQHDDDCPPWLGGSIGKRPDDRRGRVPRAEPGGRRHRPVRRALPVAPGDRTAGLPRRAGGVAVGMLTPGLVQSRRTGG